MTGATPTVRPQCRTSRTREAVIGAAPAMVKAISIVLLRRDLPVVCAGLRGNGSCSPRRGEFCHHFVDMTTAVADHKHDLYATVGCWSVGHVQVDLHAPSAVGIDLISTRFLPFRRKIRFVHRSKAVAYVITLGQMAPAVEDLDPGHNLRDDEVRGAESVSALERRVRAAEIVASSCPRPTVQRRQRDQRCYHSIPKPSFHRRLPAFGLSRTP